ncbi:MAG: ATP-grasp domain-containing protein [Egibacteraceae bacterium]
MVTVALATAAAVPDLEEGDRLLLDALVERGARARPAVWDDDTVNWAEFDLVLIRSTWDYAERRADFLAWAETVTATATLANSLELVRWNTDKRYLRELAAEGAPVVPTTWLEPGQPVRLPEQTELVVKPAISAGSRGTARYRPSELARAITHARALLEQGRPVMAQPYVRSVDARGETALVYLDGRFSHAVEKGPLLRVGEPVGQELYKAETIQPRAHSPAEREVADRIMELVRRRFSEPLYARVDLVEDDRGEPQLLELELTEPSLFLGHADGAAGRLAVAALGRR